MISLNIKKRSTAAAVLLVFEKDPPRYARVCGYVVGTGVLDGPKATRAERSNLSPPLEGGGCPKSRRGGVCSVTLHSPNHLR